MHAGFGAEFGEKVICMSFKSNHSKMFLEHKAITIGYSGRISSLPTIFLSESGERNRRHQNSLRIPVGKSGGFANKNPFESKVNTLSFF